MSQYKHSDKIAHCIITNWAVSLGGEHFTVRVDCGKINSDRLEYPLTTKQAIMLNKKDSAYGAKYKKGQMSTRFWTEEEACEAAIKYVQEHLPDCRLLVRSSGGILEPCPVVWCSSEKYGAQLGAIADGTEKLWDKTDDAWSKFPDKMEAYDGSWWGIISLLYGD